MRFTKKEQTITETRNSLLSNGTCVNHEKGSRPKQSLFTDTKLLNQSSVLLDIFLFEIIEKASALADKLE